MSTSIKKSKFDAIIIGTGLTETIISGALSRAGKQVLHLEPESRYGHEFAGLGLLDLLRDSKWSEKVELNMRGTFEVLGDIAINTLSETTVAFLMKFFPDYYDEYLNQKVISKEVEFIEKLLQNNRHYCLEISPKIVYCKGSLIELIANSGVGPSLEFQMPNALYLFRNGELEKVPGSKEDIFSNNDISLIDKRKIMKFFTFVLDFNPSCDENQHFKSLSFAEYLKSLKIPEKLIQTIIVSITFVIEQDMYQTLSAFDGILKCQLYLKSIGIYGNGAFLTALYGTGSELCQAFSRYSAVFGGCYILDCDVKSIQLSNDTITIESAEHIFESSKLIINRNYCQLLSSQPLIVTNRTFRLICISDTPFVSDGKHSIILSPPNQLDHTNGVHMIHYCGDNYVCPQDILHLTARSDMSHLRSIAKQFAKGPYLEIAFVLETLDFDAPSNIIVTPDPGNSIDCERTVKDAKDILHVFGEFDFYPKKEPETDP